MFTDWLETVASSKQLSGEDFRVLLTLLANAEGFTVEIPQTEIAQKLDLQATHVSRSIKNLCLNGFIKKKKIGGKLVGYHFVVAESNRI